MRKTYPMQQTFGGGSISPLMYGRTELPGYHKSAKLIRNMLVDSRGALYSRPGSEYKFPVADVGNTDGRLFTFRVNYTTTFIVAVTPTKVWITDQGGLSESVNKLTNGDFAQGSTGWTQDNLKNGQVTFESSTCRLTSGLNIPTFSSVPFSRGRIRQQVTGLTPANQHRIRVESQLISGWEGNQALNLRVGTTQGASDILNVVITDASYDIIFTPNSADVWVELDVESQIGSFDTGSGTQQFSFSQIVQLNSVSLTDFAMNPQPGNVNFPSPYNADQLQDIQVEMAPDIQRMYFVHRGVTPQKLEYNVSTDAWTFAAETFTHDSGQDPWQTEFPGAITFHQGRLILASTVSNPVTIWGSKPGRDDYANFTKSTGQNPDDAFQLTIARNADIQWVKGGKVLYVGCDNSEHVVFSSGAVITPQDVETDQISSYGSSRIMSDWISENIGYVSLDKRRVRIIDYRSNSREVDSPDLTWPAEHLTWALIDEVHHVSNPDNQFWCVMANGDLISGTYDDQYNVLGWTEHNLGFPVRSITVAEEAGESVVYALGFIQGSVYLFRIGRTGVWMDGYAVRNYSAPQTKVDQLDHLEGLTVQAIGDGAYYGEYTVESGEFTIDASLPAVANYTVGLKETREIVTIDLDTMGGPVSTKSFLKSWNRVFVKLFDSALPIISSPADLNGTRQPTRSPDDAMDIVVPNKSRDVPYELTGWGYAGDILIYQDLPFNFILTGIYGELSESNV